MSDFQREKTSWQQLASPLGDTLQASSPPLLPSISQRRSEHSPKASPLPEASKQIKFKRHLSQNSRRHRRIPLEIQFRDLLALFDKIVASAITVGAQSHDPTDHVTARALDDCLFELRMWLENLRTIIPDTASSSSSLRALEKLEGPAASTFRNVLNDLEADLTELLAKSPDTGLTFTEGFRATCDRVKVSVDRLDKHQDALVEEFMSRERDIYDMIDKENSSTNQKLSVLCFDGGGVRSYSSLMIIKALMDEIRSVIGASEDEAGTGSIRPCDMFEYIFGSSSGGLIAIMLGRLNMKDEQCMETFRSYADSIFHRHRRAYDVSGGLYKSKYSEKSLIRATKLVVGSFDPNPESQKWKRNMFAAPGERCRCGVIAYTKPVGEIDREVPYIFRTYDNPSNARNPGMANDYQIWQVARATTAAPRYFPLAKFDGREFLDGGFGTNNPSHEASMELSTIHPKGPTCLVSIGSGKRQAISRFKPRSLRLYSYIQAAVRLATDTEIVHENMRELAAHSEKFSYFRFDVPGLEDVIMDEWTVKRRKQLSDSERMHTIAFIERQTHQYLAQAETRESIRICAQMVVESRSLLRESSSHLSQESHLKQEIVQTILQVPARNNIFHGQEEALHRMYEHLKPHAVGKKNSRLRSCALYGLGGIGKTQIAIEYIYRYKHDYAYVFWVRASTESHLADSYSSIAPMIGHGIAKDNVQQNIQMARQWLSNTDATWLLVFDDVDRAERVNPYFPASTKGSIIITSRRSDVRVPGSLKIEVEPLKPQSGASLLNSIISHREVSDSARQISELCGGLPLAIVQAGVYVNETAISLARYLQLCKDQYNFQFLNVRALTTWQSEQTLKTVFDHTLAPLSPDARKLVECMAFLNPDDIPEELFLRSNEHALLPQLVTNFLSLRTELLTRCLILRNDSRNTPTFSMHRVVKSELLCRLIPDRERYQEVFFQAFYMIRAVVPHIPPDDQPISFTDGSTFETYLPHVLCLDEAHVHCDQTYTKDKDDLEFVELLSDVGLYLLANRIFNQVDLARRLHQKVLETRTSLLGWGHPSTLTTMANLASTYSGQKLWDEAEKLWMQVMKTSEKTLGSKHPFTLTSMASLASTYVSQKRWDEAEKLNMRVMNTRFRMLGAENPDTLMSMDNLAFTYSNQGRLKEAEELEMQVMEARKKLLGAEHPDTHTSMENLAYTHISQGHQREAIELINQVIQLRTRRVGPDHPLTLDSIRKLREWSGARYDSGTGGDSGNRGNPDLKMRTLRREPRSATQVVAGGERDGFLGREQEAVGNSNQNPEVGDPDALLYWWRGRWWWWYDPRVQRPFKRIKKP